MNPLPATLLLLVCTWSLASASTPDPLPQRSAPAWLLPQTRQVELGGPLGAAFSRGVQRLSLPPYDSPEYLRSDFSFETNRIFVNYSGDISGRFIQIASLVSTLGQMTPPTLPEVLRDFAKYQKVDGHFGREVDWNLPLEPESSKAVMLPIFWGNSRLLVGLLEAYRAFGRADCLAAARRIGDFYVATAGRFLDPAREPEYRMTGSYAAGYPTDYFPGIEGLALLYQATRDERYLRQAERMADFFQRFDTLPVDHSHGNLVTHYGLLLLYEMTGKSEYLARPLAQWQKAVEGGFVWPMGGVGERFHVCSPNDEGCSEADWLRLNLRLWEFTGETRFLDMAERLLWNHYAMNRTANGGYGHHEFLCDDQGPLLMQPKFTEAVWCCTFHGLLGLNTLKRYVVVGSPQGVLVNFPVSATAPVETGRGRWKVSIAAEEPALGEIRCRVRLEPIKSDGAAPEILIRRPPWATRVTVEDRPGRTLPAREENGYLRTSVRSGAAGEVTVRFSGSARVEDRRMRPVALNSASVTREAGVTLWVGPHLLLANVDRPRPVLLARTAGGGQLILPAANRFPQLDRIDADAGQIEQAANSASRVQLDSWENVRREAPAAFIFDLVTLPGGDTPANYGRAVESVVKPAFLPLPPGAVEPSGWLRDWAQAARDGITGHLDERHATFADGWKGTPIQATGAAADGTGWPIEQSAYWLDGALRLGFVLHDEALIRKIRARLDPVVEGVNQAEFGTSFIYWKKGFKPADFDSWAHSHLGRALLALYQGTGEKPVLDAMVKVYADYPTNMGNLRLDGGGVSGLCNLDPMLEVYSLSGEKRILDRALQALNQPPVVSEIQSWNENRLAPGHMVIFYENIRLPAVAYPWTGNSQHLEATLNAFRWLDDHHMLPYGVASGEEFASGVGAFRKTETCDVTAMLLASSWMYRIEGRADWGDRMERAFFNAGAAPVARDFQTMCYYQSPNRLRSDSLPCEQTSCPGPGGIRFSQLGCSNVLCCVGALNRIIPNYIIHMWMATPDQGLAATLYGPSTVSALAGPRVPVRFTTRTDYPFGEVIQMRVEPEKDVAFPLYLRIPGWCKAPKITVDGATVKPVSDNRGFVKIERTWTRTSLVELSLAMQPTLVRGYETEFPAVNRAYFKFEPDSLFRERRLPYESLVYGPLLFALPIPDTDPNTPAGDSRWQFALDNRADQNGRDIRVRRTTMPARWNWPLAAPIALEVPARSFPWEPTDAQALPDAPVSGGKSETITLVPYGCTKFRVSMFPVTAQAWQPSGPPNQ